MWTVFGVYSNGKLWPQILREWSSEGTLREELLHEMLKEDYLSV